MDAGTEVGVGGGAAEASICQGSVTAVCSWGLVCLRGARGGGSEWVDTEEFEKGAGMVRLGPLAHIF